MAAPAGELFVKLAADVAGFKTDLDRATRMAEGWSKTFRSAVGGAIATVAGSLTVGAFAAMTKNAIDAADEMGKMAQRVGTSVEQLSALDVQARLANVSTDQLSAGLKQLARNTAEFVAGGGEAADAFRAIGISQEQAAAATDDTAKLFDLVAGKIANYADGINKTAILMKIFGRSGAELAPLINEIKNTRKEAEFLNAIIGKDAAQAAERFNDNLTRVSIAVRGIFLNISAGLLPTLEKLSETWARTAKDARELGNAVAIAGTAVKLLASAGAIAAAVFENLGKGLGALFAAKELVAEGKFREAFNALKEGVADVRANLGGTAKFLETLWDDAARTNAAKAPDIAKKIAAPVLISAEMVNKAQKEMADAINRQHDDIMAGIEADKEILRQQALVNQSFVETAQLAQEAADAMVYTWDQAGNRIEMTREAFDELGRQQKKNEEMAKDLGFTFASAFEDAIVQGKGLRDILKGIEQDIARIILRRTVTEPMANAIAAAFGFATSSSGGAAGGVTAMEEGGAVSAFTPYLVGERGPELFLPNVAGEIVPNDELIGERTINNRTVNNRRRTVRNRTVNNVARVTINVGSLDPRGAAAVIAANSEVIRGVIRGAFNRQGRRSPI